MNAIEHNNLVVPLPQDWVDASQVIALGPLRNQFRMNLVFSQEATEPGESVIGFAERQLPMLEAVLGNYKLLRGGPARFGPNEGYLREHAFATTDGEVEQFQFYCVLDARCYTFTFTCRKGDLELGRPIAEGMFAQARLTPPAFVSVEDDF